MSFGIRHSLAIHYALQSSYLSTPDDTGKQISTSNYSPFCNLHHHLHSVHHVNCFTDTSPIIRSLCPAQQVGSPQWSRRLACERQSSRQRRESRQCMGHGMTSSCSSLVSPLALVLRPCEQLYQQARHRQKYWKSQGHVGFCA